MKTIGAILLVLALFASPVLGADSASEAGAAANDVVATQYTYSWADNGWEYAEAGTDGLVVYGVTESSSGATASDPDMYASAGTGGYSTGLYAETDSGAYAYDDDSNGVTDANADSYAIGYIVDTDSYAGGSTYPESWAGAGGWAIYGYTDSSAFAEAYIP